MANICWTKHDTDNRAMALVSAKGLLRCCKISWTLVHKRLKTEPEVLRTLTIYAIASGGLKWQYIAIIATFSSFFYATRLGPIGRYSRWDYTLRWYWPSTFVTSPIQSLKTLFCVPTDDLLRTKGREWRERKDQLHLTLFLGSGALHRPSASR